MSYIALNDESYVICINPKAGSMSMYTALSQVPNTDVKPSIALGYSRRVVFIRHPITRLNSLFNMVWAMALNNSSSSDLIPDGLINAFSARVEGKIGSNEHRWSEEKKAAYADQVVIEKANGNDTDEKLIIAMNNKDYHGFVDHILSGAQDDHWGNQVDLCAYNNQFIPTVAHRFEAINNYWNIYVNAPLPKENSWPAVPHDEYKLNELKAYYAKDITFWEGVNGTWNAG